MSRQEVEERILAKEDSPVTRMMLLFEGFAEAYGTYDGTISNEAKGGKLEIKATATTRRETVTHTVWDQHLKGNHPLGIIPIRSNNTCLWGCIDIDQYNLSPDDILKSITKNNFPLVVCRSKSGGMHIFLFFSEPVAAAVIQMRLKEMAAILGYGNSEIFPKQRQVQTEKGDLGSWLNMPYFGGDQSDRYGFKAGGLAMTLSEFLAKAWASRQPASYAETEHRRRPDRDPDWGDGPPCMQHLVASGFPEGVRNKSLFALGVFAKKKYATDWVQRLERWNMQYFDPPLPSAEVHGIIKAHEKKDYNYTCKEQPLSAHCNSGLCRTRRYGVGGDDDFPVVSGLSVLDTDPPLWFLDVEDARLELNTEQLQTFRLFHKVCMEKLFRCYRMIKQDVWLTIVAEAMREAVRIEAPQEVGQKGQFNELLYEFITDRHKAEQKEELLLGRPWTDDEEGKSYFRLIDLQRYLESSNFKIYNRAQIVSRLKELGGDSKFFNLKGRGVNTWWIPADITEEMPEISLPKLVRTPL